MLAYHFFSAIFEPPNYVAYVFTGMGREVQGTENRNKESWRAFLKV